MTTKTLKTAKKLLTNHTEILNSEYTFREEPNPDFSNSIYIEDGDLISTDLVRIDGLDIECRYTTGLIGIFKVEPSYFDYTIEETWIEPTKHFYRYVLNNYGWEQLAKQGLKDTDRGWKKATLITRRDLERIKERELSSASKLTDNIKRYQSL
jgi:hypothetical protein